MPLRPTKPKGIYSQITILAQIFTIDYVRICAKSFFCKFVSWILDYYSAQASIIAVGRPLANAPSG